MSPIIPVAVVALALAGGYELFFAKGSSLPPDLQATFDQVLAKGSDPDALEALAAKLDGLGFHREAVQLRTKAALLRGGGAPAPSPVAPAVPGGGTNPAAPRVDPLPVPAAPAAPVVPAGPSLPAQFMKVTTNDPAPSGDLALRDAPSNSANVIGAAEKDSVVTVKGVSPDGQFVQVEALNPAGRRPSATGWGHAAFLVPTNPMKTSGASRAALVGAARILCAGMKPPAAKSATCIASNGSVVRPVPTYAVGSIGVIPRGARVTVLSCVGTDGTGFCCVQSGSVKGWVPTSDLAFAGKAAA